MPTYEYRCPEGHDFERFYRKISDATAEVTCPECGKIAARIMSAGGGLLFKGSGFYLTDYGKNAHRSSAPGTKPEKGGQGGSSEKGGEGGSSEKAGDAGSKEAAPTASKESASSGKSETKSPSESKPAASAPKAESKPAPTGGSSSKKDK